MNDNKRVGHLHCIEFDVKVKFTQMHQAKHKIPTTRNYRTFIINSC